jgi:SAM-dependent methyltransferase
MEKNNTNDFLIDVANYYTSKLAEHGDVPKGVDWNNEESQIIRFKQLAKIIRLMGSFSINDLGSGYGALYDYLQNLFSNFSYIGCDVSEAMITAANQRHVQNINARFLLASEPPGIADYGVASGIFNVRLEQTNAKWQHYIEETLNILDCTSRLGFAFNCLTSYSDVSKMRDELYYADPCYFFDYCKRNYSKQIALLHDYGLYEFTILVRKDR